MAHNSHHDHIDTQYDIEIGTAPGDEGIEILLREISQGASYDSHGQHHPGHNGGIQENILKEVYHWIDNPTTPILWLNGFAGAGKSAIAQIVAQKCANDRILSGSFFFRRGDISRGDPKHFIFSLAYQISVAIPEKKMAIGQAVEKDVSIFSKGMDDQLRTLIIEPFTHEAFYDRCVVLVIDGIDKCFGDDNQRQVVGLIAQLACPTNLPFLCLVVSQPEPQIADAFESYKGLVTIISMRDHEKTDGEIRKALCDGFNTIYKKHAWEMRSVPLPWPPNEVVETLVQNANRMVIYVSTILKHLDDNHSPPNITLEHCLDAQFSLPALRPLDRLYLQILSSSLECEREGLLHILGFKFLAPECPGGIKTMEALLHLRDGETARVLRRLHSIIDFHTDVHNVQFFFHRASFQEFMLNRTRAGAFYIDPAEEHAHIARKCLEYIENCVIGVVQVNEDAYYYSLLHWASHYQKGANSNNPVLSETVQDLLGRNGLLQMNKGLFPPEFLYQLDKFGTSLNKLLGRRSKFSVLL